MYLKEIQTLGFKSFADKLNFEFTNNINGIVGPNGSGKSNVVDAIRWVLGEQSNKQLRADSNTSVIFSGSKSRKPLNSAMVNLIFDNTDRHLAIDFNEVSIKRVLYRTGENEYYLNGSKCRLKDISEILTDSGAARESFNIIGQGKIDEILSTKPYDRRIVFEEAAGVLKYKKRKEEALRKLERTNNNINRINDIISEIESNLNPLREQAEEAKKYNDFKTILTDKEISLILYDIDNYSNSLNQYKERINNLNDEISKISANNASYDVNMLKYKEKINEIDVNISNLHNNILALTKSMEQTDADIRISKERKKYLKDNTDNNINSIRENKLSLESKLKELINKKDLINKNVDISNESLNDYNSKYNSISNEINNIKDTINKNNIAITDLNYKINYLENSINNGGGVPLPVKNILNNPKFSGVRNTIGALIKVDNEYALAVSTSLGAASNYLVVNTKSIASKLVLYLKENHLGRATFFPLDVIKERHIDTDSLDKIKNVDGFIDVLVNKVNFDIEYQNVMLNQLGNVILADNIENANLISKIVSNRYKIVTLDGQVVNVGGSITGGDKIKNEDTIKQRYDLDDYKNKMKVLVNSNEELNNKITSLDSDKNVIDNKISSLRMEIYNYNMEIEDISNNIDSLKSSINDLDNEIHDIDNNGDDLEASLLQKYYKLKDEISLSEKNMNILKADRDKIEKDILELDELAKNNQVHVSLLEKEIHDMEIKNSKYEVKIDDGLRILNEDYSITYNEAKDKYKLEGNPDDYRKQVLSLKNSIKDIGVVNLGSILEYERVNERYNFLTKQREDLNNAYDTLLEIINDMDNIMKEKFINTFNEIRVEFKKVFKELFRGGNADIYLTEPDNILETGIELEATPPGKNLKNISALSGGERTFTAISLLFAILNVRPVPFCVLDEVEAALDEANVDAFGEYLNKYRDKTQFILITHKKKTMEYIDTLYGITMQESGVSKLVSVKLDSIK